MRRAHGQSVATFSRARLAVDDAHFESVPARRLTFESNRIPTHSLEGSTDQYSFEPYADTGATGNERKRSRGRMGRRKWLGP